MTKIISKKKRSLTDAGNSKRISIVKEWLQILEIEDEEEVVTALLYTDKHGFFFDAWKEDEQPDLDDLEQKVSVDLGDDVDIDLS